ncbi:single-stranded DNA-binding protein [bacterium]|nr:single-stranded DNA-binding protein [bacterium]
MANRCLNKVMLIGNLTRDPELRYTPQGVAVCSFGIATNRRWTTQGGEQKEDAQFHRIVAWNKLAELCSQLLKKGSRIYVEGRLQYREWTDKEGRNRRDAEIVIEDMILLEPRQGGGGEDVEGELAKSYAPEEGQGDVQLAGEEQQPQEEGALGETSEPIQEETQEQAVQPEPTEEETAGEEATEAEATAAVQEEQPAGNEEEQQSQEENQEPENEERPF